ncbi:MAG: hypothetical protein ACI8RD_013478 [Bacillariaceae sp.]|jgi:hypothetical protein
MHLQVLYNYTILNMIYIFQYTKLILLLVYKIIIYRRWNKLDSNDADYKNVQNTAFDTINEKETFFINPVIVDIIS